MRGKEDKNEDLGGHGEQAMPQVFCRATACKVF